MAPAGVNYWSLSLIVIPSVFLVFRLLLSFPQPPEPIAIYPSLASLPRSARSWSIYPEDFYDGGAYATLPFGRVRYWLMGPENGEKVVLIHGFSVPSIIWKDVAPELAKNGYRVLLYDLYGRGYSDAPNLPYDSSLYTTQLALLMQHIKWDQAHIVGLSMGGGVATAFSAIFPNLTTGKLALIASAGLMDASDFSRTSRIMSSNLVASVASSHPVRLLLQRLGSGDYSSNPLHEIVRIQSAYLPGYNYALASSLRSGPLRGLLPSFERVGSQKTDTLLIWGTADRTVPYRYASRIQQLIPNSTLVTIENGPHDLTISHPREVSKALLEFLHSKNP